MATLTLLPSPRPTARVALAPSTRPSRVVRPIEQPSAGLVGPPSRRTGGQRRPSSERPRAVPCGQSYAADLHGSRLTTRGRLVVALLWIVLVAAAALAVLRPGAGSTDVGRLDTTTVVVESGDTMWGLARSIDAQADPRAVVDAIVELNGLPSGADIHPGDVLVVPLVE